MVARALAFPATVGVAGRGIQTVGRENGVHPVRDYLHALDRDGTPRLNTWLTRYLGVGDSLYVQAVGPLISAVARVENHAQVLTSAGGRTEEFGPPPRRAERGILKPACAEALDQTSPSRRSE